MPSKVNLKKFWLHFIEFGLPSSTFDHGTRACCLVHFPAVLIDAFNCGLHDTSSSIWDISWSWKVEGLWDYISASWAGTLTDSAMMTISETIKAATKTQWMAHQLQPQRELLMLWKEILRNPRLAGFLKLGFFFSEEECRAPSNLHKGGVRIAKTKYCRSKKLWEWTLGIVSWENLTCFDGTEWDY